MPDGWPEIVAALYDDGWWIGDPVEVEDDLEEPDGDEWEYRGFCL